MMARCVTLLVAILCRPRYGYGGHAGGNQCFIPTIENGWLEGEIGDTDTYTGKVRCNHGFELAGGETVECNQGHWTQLEPVFCAAISPCEDDLPELENGFKQSVSGY